MENKIEVCGKSVTLTKVEDTKFEGLHPNGIGAGYVKTGAAVNDVEVGNVFMVSSGMGVMRTSLVVGVNDDMTFNTENSVYKIEITDEK
jgi:hypothetical protein